MASSKPAFERGFSYGDDAVMETGLQRGGMSAVINVDAAEFSEAYDPRARPVGLDLAGHDMAIMGPKVVVMDAFVVDLLTVDTSAQTFRAKLLLSCDWEDDGILAPEVKAKRKMGGTTLSKSDTYRTGKYALKEQYKDDPTGLTWNPEVVLVNAMADEEPIEAGSNLHSVQMLHGRPVISRIALYQPECRCEFTFKDFPFDETDLVVKFSSTKWSADQVEFVWTNRLRHEVVPGDRTKKGGGRATLARQASLLRHSVDPNAIGGVGLSEFEIIQVRVEHGEQDVDSMQRYDGVQGALGQSHLIIRVRRDPYSYLLRVCVVAELLMFLEVLSFLADTGDNDSSVNLADRFSISGTNFLAMVELYGNMSDNLPKVSVVTRVDKWHTVNFLLLFVSNMENLAVFCLRNYINIKVMEFTETLLGILYLVAVVRNLLWFLQPIKQREEFAVLQMVWKDWVDVFRDRVSWLVGRGTPPWRRQPVDARRKPMSVGIVLKAFTEARRASQEGAPDLMDEFRRSQTAEESAKKRQ